MLLLLCMVAWVVQFLYAGLNTARVPVNDFTGYGQVRDSTPPSLTWLTRIAARACACDVYLCRRNTRWSRPLAPRPPTPHAPPAHHPSPTCVWQVLSTVIFNWGFLTTVPSWLNEKRPDVSVSRATWVSILLSLVIFLILGFGGGMGLDLPNGENLLAALNDPDAPNILLTSQVRAETGVNAMGGGALRRYARRGAVLLRGPATPPCRRNGARACTIS